MNLALININEYVCKRNAKIELIDNVREAKRFTMRLSKGLRRNLERIMLSRVSLKST